MSNNWDEHAKEVATGVEHSLSLLKAYADELTVKVKADKFSREYRKYFYLSLDLDGAIDHLEGFKKHLEEFKEEKNEGRKEKTPR